MKLKRSEVMELDNVFKSLMEMKLEPTTAFKIASNSILSSELADKVRKSYKPVDGHEEVEKLRSEFLKDLGATHNPAGGFTIPAELAYTVGAQIDKFNKEHADVLEAQREYDEKFKRVLDHEVEIEFEKIKLEELTVEIEPGKLVRMIKTGIITNGSK